MRTLMLWGILLALGGLQLLTACGRDGRQAAAERTGKLEKCPGTPNCVSSLDRDIPHGIAPLAFTSSPAEAMECLRRAIQSMKRVTLCHADERYLHAEFRTLLGFVDDVEFAVDAEKRLIDMRSASRVGTWDLGVNRRRLEAVRKAFNAGCL